MSLTIISKRIRESGITNRSTIVKILLSKTNVAKRLEWATENLQGDWSNDIFTDKPTFWMNNYWKRFWPKQGETMVQHTKNHPVKVHVYGYFSRQRFAEFKTFTANLNPELIMVDLYKKALLESAKKLYGTDKKIGFNKKIRSTNIEAAYAAAGKKKMGLQFLIGLQKVQISMQLNCIGNNRAET